MKSSYPQAITFVLKQEGGYTNHPADPGGPTNFGITIADARRYWKADATAADVRAMPLSVAKSIYASKYWAVVSGDDLKEGLDLCTFDSAVNSGTGRAYKWLSKALGVPETKSYATLAAQSTKLTYDVPSSIKRFCATRLSFLHSLKTWGTFGKGWGRRVAELQALALVLYHTAQGKTPTEVQVVLKKEAKTTAASKSTDKTIVATGTTGTSASVYSFWEWDVTHVLILGVAVVAIAFVVRSIIQKNKQITAYDDQIAQLEALKATSEQV